MPMGIYPRPTAENRFWRKVDKSGDCWIWFAGRNKQGYGHFWCGGKTRLAHRYSFELANGPIPAGMDVLHRCDTPPCVNPAHLFSGVQFDNMHDMIKKGRHVSVFGEKVGNHKLSESQVLEIFNDARLQREIATDYGVGLAQVSRIKSKHTWKRLLTTPR